jgi:hypothetical protein
MGIILTIVLLWQVYKAAKESGRSGLLWTVLAFVGSIALQFLIGLFLGIVFMAGSALWGWPEDLLAKLIWPINILALAINAVLLWLLIKYLSRVPDSEFVTPPPPPPNFN